MLHYILQVVAFQLLFLIIYDIFLQKETFFNLNRAYLLVTALLSVVIPFIKIEQIKDAVARDFVISLPEVIIGNPSEKISTIHPEIAMQAGINLEPQPVSIWTIILISGMCLAILLLVFKISKLLWLASKHPKRWLGDLLIIELINSTKAFSFFHYIFLGQKLNTQEQSTILEHEKVHVYQKHTFDLLFFEAFRIVFWFNPLVYIYQNRMATLHEYIADSKAVKQYNKADYYDNLLAQVFETQQFSFVNPFFKHSLIKKRILMLSKSKSRQINMIKYMLLLPLVFTMLIYTSSYAQEKVQTITETLYISDSQELTDQELFDKYYNEIIELEKKGADFEEVYKLYVADNNNYILTREQYFKNSALYKYIFRFKYEDINKGKPSDEKYKELVNRFEILHPYQDYLDHKKTDEAKQSWEGAIQNGVLRLVVNDTENMTGEEDEKYNKKLEFLEKDDFYTGVLVVSADGKRKMMVHDSNTNMNKPTTTVTDDVEVIELEDAIEVPFNIVDETPTYSFCQSLKTNEERKKCMSDGISKHVAKKFNTNLADSLGLVGRQRINVMFKINKEGHVIDVRSRAAHPKLEEEAIRVISELPQFIPGKQKGHLVTVPYSLPIIFQVKADPKESEAQNTELSEKIDTLKDALETSVNKQSNGVSFDSVEEVPMYESCTELTTNDERKQCVNTAVGRFIAKNFNTKLASKLGLTGKQKIYVLFQIDTLGDVKIVKARAPHPALEAEAKRVISSLPQFIPGKINNKPVIVDYSLPIVFQVAVDKNQDKKN